MTPEEEGIKKKLEEYRRQKEQKKLEEMFRDDAGVGKALSERSARRDRHGCLFMLFWAALMGLFVLFGKSCLGWR